jgi:hypothetical protein
MAQLDPRDGRPATDYLARDYDGLLQAMRQLVPQTLPEWTGFDNEADFGNVLLELFAHLGDVLGYYQDRVVTESFLSTARTRRSVIEHMRLIGYQLATAAPAAAVLTVSVPQNVTDTVQVQRGDAFATRSQKTRPSVRFEYNLQTSLVIDFSRIAADPASRRKTYGDPALGTGIPVEQGRLFLAEVLGVGDDSPDQRYRVPHPGVIRRPPGAAQQASQDVLVTTQLGAVVQEWTLRDTLAFSAADDHDFVLEIDEDDQATVVFGDGTFGALPPNGAVISVAYRTGGGAVGNVPAGAIDTIVDARALSLLGATVRNPAPATGGAERESIEHAVRHAPAVFRSLRRAVTAADYEAIALSFKGVGKVRAVSTGWNRVTLLVAPAGGGKVSDVLETGLKAYLEDKRMLSQVIEIEDVDYVPILVTAQIAIESYYPPADVVAAVRQTAAALLDFDAVSFGQAVYLSKFYEEAQNVPGVSFVNIVEFRRGDATGAAGVPGAAVEPSGRIVLGSNELPVVPADPDYADGIKIDVLSAGGQ